MTIRNPQRIEAGCFSIVTVFDRLHRSFQPFFRRLICICTMYAGMYVCKYTSAYTCMYVHKLVAVGSLGFVSFGCSYSGFEQSRRCLESRGCGVVYGM